MKIHWKAILAAAAAVVAAASELSAQTVVGGTLLTCEGRDVEGQGYRATIGIKSQVTAGGLTTAYQVAARKTPHAGRPRAKTFAAEATSFTMAGGGQLQGAGMTLDMGAWQDGVIAGNWVAPAFAPEGGVALTCRRVTEDRSRRVTVAPFAADDQAQLQAVMAGLVVAYEGLPLNEDDRADDDRHLSLLDGSVVCTADARAGILACEAAYLQGRWNGDVSARFLVKDGQVQRFLGAEFDGSF